MEFDFERKFWTNPTTTTAGIVCWPRTSTTRRVFRRNRALTVRSYSVRCRFRRNGSTAAVPVSRKCTSTWILLARATSKSVPAFCARPELAEWNVVRASGRITGWHIIRRSYCTKKLPCSGPWPAIPHGMQSSPTLGTFSISFSFEFRAELPVCQC